MPDYSVPPNTDWVALWLGNGGLPQAQKTHTRHGASVVGLCQAHDDHNPSLQLWVGADGWPQCKCYAGCDRIAVMESLAPRLWPNNHPALLALRKGTYQAPARKPLVRPKGPGQDSQDDCKRYPPLALDAPPPPELYPFALKNLHEDIVKAEPSEHGPWTYHAMPDGQPVLRVYRYDLVKRDGKLDKTFRQATPRHERGKVRWGGSGLSYEDLERGLRVFPYGYERIDLYPKMPLIWVEGEKSADALRTLSPDLIALSLIGSRPEAHDLEGLVKGQSRYHVIWPDPDEPGDQKAEWLYARLTKVRGQHLAVLPPQALDLRDKEDAWDWCRRQDTTPNEQARHRLLSVMRRLPFKDTPIR